MTTNTQIDNYLRDDKMYRGTKSIDQVTKLKDNEYMIVNFHTSDPSNPGSHWVMVYQQPNKKLIYYDSYGCPPQDEIVALKKKGHQIMYSTFQCQQMGSDVCGEHCINVSRQLQNGKSFIDIIYDYSDNHKLNDDTVRRLIKI